MHKLHGDGFMGRNRKVLSRAAQVAGLPRVHSTADGWMTWSSKIILLSEEPPGRRVSWRSLVWCLAWHCWFGSGFGAPRLSHCWRQSGCENVRAWSYLMLALQGNRDTNEYKGQGRSAVAHPSVLFIASSNKTESEWMLGVTVHPMPKPYIPILSLSFIKGISIFV